MIRALIAVLFFSIHSWNLIIAQELVTEPESKVFATVGFMHGGGSLIGIDIETEVLSGLGFQVGAGIVAAGASINFHFKPNLRSSYINLQYMHQGFGVNFAQNIIGTSIVYRGKKWFTAQLGVGRVIESYVTPDKTILLYSIGIYQPIKRVKNI